MIGVCPSSVLRFRPSRLVLALTLAAPFFCLAAPADAASSPWAKVADSEVRLISDKVPDEPGKLIAGVDIRLNPGWTTYWKNPGDAGVPPSFDWSGSKNVKTVHVLYPAPNSYDEAGGVAYGYRDEVVFPVTVTPEDPSQPVELDLKLDYGLCENLCIPAQAKLSLAIAPDAPQDAAEKLLLESFLAAVPQPAEPGKLPAITRITPKLARAKPKIVIDAVFPKDSERADIYTDAPDVYVPPAVPEGSRTDGKQRYVITFENKHDADDVKGKTVTLTMVGDGGARETQWTMK
jgi:DsbC/DsbD-like thiol-disulfide interchange protein